MTNCEQRTFSNVERIKNEFKDAQSRRHASVAASIIGQIAERDKFDWKSKDDVFNNLLSEVEELKEEWESSKSGTQEDKIRRVIDELGDVYFSLAQLCRHLNINPETVTSQSSEKFCNRFIEMKRLATKSCLDWDEISHHKRQNLWQQAKKSLQT